MFFHAATGVFIPLPVDEEALDENDQNREVLKEKRFKYRK